MKNLSDKRSYKAKIPFLLDPSIVILVIILTLFGLLMIYSTISVSDSENIYFFKQLNAVIAGIFVMFFASRINIKSLYKISKYMAIAALILVILPLIPGIGSNAGGAQRWVKIAFFRLQPGEFVKIAAIVFLANYYSRHENGIKTWKEGFVIPLICFLGVIGGIFLLQPDFGSAAVLFLAGAIMACALGVRIKHFLLAALPLAFACVLVVAAAPYRLKRIEAFLHPFEDTSGKSYQLIQSLITIASGGFSGVGLGNSQQKLHFLPAAHTDFILSVIAEEFGFIGVIVLISLFFIFFLRCLKIASRVSYDTFSYALAMGLLFLILVPAFANFGIVTGLLPTKGLVLPFIGFGGSNVIASFFTVGLLLAIVRGVYKRDI